MAEYRSPKPGVEGSSPPWPADIFDFRYVKCIAHREAAASLPGIPPSGVEWEVVESSGSSFEQFVSGFMGNVLLCVTCREGLNEVAGGML